MRLIEAIEDTSRQHSPLDRPEHLSPTYLRSAAQVALASVANLAWGPDAPRTPHMAGPDTIAWGRVAGAADYAVAFRRADALEFDTILRPGSVTGFTADAIFQAGYGFVSVAAINAEGEWSAFSPEVSLMR